ncbi:hypothetical protein GFS60_06820 (plasmid) [Rhodococcus sp. WAY2]|nr:hypothetical protein GFS60_06820 [Rhodococcus sp. WAY2]
MPTIFIQAIIAVLRIAARRRRASPQGLLTELAIARASARWLAMTAFELNSTPCSNWYVKSSVGIEDRVELAATQASRDRLA